MPLPLRPGDQGPMVRQMQNALIKKGFSVGTMGADGDFGQATLTGLTTFQDDNALPGTAAVRSAVLERARPDVAVRVTGFVSIPV